MLDSRLATGQVSLNMKPAPKHMIAVKSDLSPFRTQCRAWSNQPTGSDIYGLSSNHREVLKKLAKNVRLLDGADKSDKPGLHAAAVACPVPLIGPIFIVFCIYRFVFEPLSELGTHSFPFDSFLHRKRSGFSYIDLPRSIKWRAFAIYVAVIGFR
jgi:hypothetical protein